MLRINRQTDYAIRVVLSLAKHPEQKRRSTAEIQREMLIPSAFSPRIVAELARGAFITTFSGRDGGIQLSRPAHQISLLQIVEHFDGPISISDCMTGRVQCVFDSNCPVRCRLGKLQAIIIRELEAITFDELALDVSEASIISLPVFNFS